MNLYSSIESAELQYKQILEEFFIFVYKDDSLSSHGIDHHRRVWNYAKELLTLLANQKPNTFSLLPSKLIIASYLHDIGMSVDKGFRHGMHSRELCLQFLAKNNLPEDDFHDVLAAIENHDIKVYTANTSANDLLTILSIADDLDAFGFIGIFRYSEIYMARGINPEKIGHLIKENAGNRFDNFAKIFSFADQHVKQHKKKYEILDNFFDEFNNQIASYKFGGLHPSGYCGVVELLVEMSDDKTAFKNFNLKSDKYIHDPVFRWFFEGLSSELS